MHVLLRGDDLQRLRIGSGLILFLFATTHFLNHALGLVNIELMHEVQQWRWVVTRSWLGTFVLLMALLIHMTLALLKLANRSTLRLPPWELAQIGLGLLIPFLLLPHIVNTRVARVLFGWRTITSMSWRASGRPALCCRARCSCWSGCTAASACTTGCGSIRPIAPRNLCCCSSPSPCRSPRSAASWCRGGPWRC